MHLYTFKQLKAVPFLIICSIYTYMPFKHLKTKAVPYFIIHSIYAFICLQTLKKQFLTVLFTVCINTPLNF